MCAGARCTLADLGSAASPKGSYFWHDHASGNHADGLTGPLIIEPEDGTPVSSSKFFFSNRTLLMADGAAVSAAFWQVRRPA